MVAKWHGKKRFGSVSGGLVEGAGTGKIVIGGIVGVANIYGLARDGGLRGHHLVVRLAILVVERNVGKIDGDAAGTAHVDTQGVRVHDLELELVVLGSGIEGAAVGVREALGALHDEFHQRPFVLLRRQGDADGRKGSDGFESCAVCVGHNLVAAYRPRGLWLRPYSASASVTVAISRP